MNNQNNSDDNKQMSQPMQGENSTNQPPPPNQRGNFANQPPPPNQRGNFVNQPHHRIREGTCKSTATESEREFCKSALPPRIREGTL